MIHISPVAVRRVLTAGALVASAAGFLGASAGTAAADPASFTKKHDISATVQFQVHQNNIFHKADTSSTKVSSQKIYQGEPNGTYGHNLILISDQADDTYGVDNLYLTEKDSTGTLHVRDYQQLSFFWHGSTVASELNVDIAPGATRSFWIYTDGAGGDYVHSLVTVTNRVS